MGRLRFTTRPSLRIGPARISANVGDAGLNSLSIRALGLTYNVPISATARNNRRAGVSSVDLPGPVSYRFTNQH